MRQINKLQRGVQWMMNRWEKGGGKKGEEAFSDIYLEDTACAEPSSKIDFFNLLSEEVETVSATGISKWVKTRTNKCRLTLEI